MSSSLNEFSLIKKYFGSQNHSRADVLLGLGDDAALLQVPAGHTLVLTTDTLVEGIHFPLHTSAFDIGYKALAVNLSDLAAMGATPAWFSLALTIPFIDEIWLTGFSQGLFELANQFGVQLVGGDTTRGPLSITITAHGFLPEGKVLLRSGAKVGNKIYVSGTLGDAGLGLEIVLGKRDLPDLAKAFVLERLNRPMPRVALGQLLRDFATSAIDVSDGLVSDLKHLLERSDVGAYVDAEKLPLSIALGEHLPPQEAYRLALTAGDDYELCFTIVPHQEKEFLTQLHTQRVSCTCIGEILTQPGLSILGVSEICDQQGFDHFS
jgi:thiamine-monophosphate kinase